MDSMRDPSTANCRIYLGNLEVNTSKSEIQNIFSKYGNIKGVLISRNFGFVQYENEQCVNNAIENEHQKMFKGRKMIVSKVQKKGNQKENDNKSNAVISEPSNNHNITNDPTPAQTNNDININTQATRNNPPVNSNKNQSNNSNNSNINMSNTNNNNNRSSANTGGGNNSNNNNANNNAGNSQQNMGNHLSRPQWRNNRNNNRNMNNSNEMNLQTDRERSPLDGGL